VVQEGCRATRLRASPQYVFIGVAAFVVNLAVFPTAIVPNFAAWPALGLLPGIFSLTYFTVLTLRERLVLTDTELVHHRTILGPRRFQLIEIDDLDVQTGREWWVRFLLRNRFRQYPVLTLYGSEKSVEFRRMFRVPPMSGELTSDGLVPAMQRWRSVVLSRVETSRRPGVGR
jgi:hypothetical protein